MTEALRTALLALDAGADLAANAAAIGQAIDEAARAGARLLLTPECALTGYPGATPCRPEAIDPAALAEAEAALDARARAAGIALGCGTIGRDAAGRWTNDFVVLGAASRARYRKRCLTPLDEKTFAPGTAPAWVDIDGWRIGLAVCFDIRFADVWADLAAGGADAFAWISHMAGPDADPGTKNVVVPALAAVRAAEWATPLLGCNTAAADRWLDTAAWDHRGMMIASRAEGLLVAEIRRRPSRGWYADLRRRGLARLVPAGPAAAT